MIDTLKRINYINLVLWLSYGLALAASVHHLAWAFGRLEFHPGLGWLPAIAVDCGMAALAYAIQQRRRHGRPAAWLWLGVVVFCTISAYANFTHAAAVQLGDIALTWQTVTGLERLALINAIILSAVLPLLVVYLGEVVSEAAGAKAATVTPVTTRPTSAPAVKAAAPPAPAGDDIGARRRQVREWLRAGELTREQMAETLGVSPTTVYRDIRAVEGNGKI